MSPDAREATARDVMTGGTDCVSENETLMEAARKFAQLDVDALPICGEDGTLTGMLTDRDIVVRGLALGMDPERTTAGEFGYGKPVTIGADDSLESVIKTMTDHNVRRLPVIDDEKFVGVLDVADIESKITADE
jgi:CBS domain-containing protein